MAATIDNAGSPKFKVCSKCGLTKPQTDYAPRKAHCRLCYNAVRRVHYARPEVNVLKNEKRRVYSQRPDIAAKRQQLRAIPEIRAKENEAAARWRSKPKNKERMRQYTAEYNAKPENKARALFSSIRLRAVKKRLPFTLTEEWVRARIIANVCELTGIEFEYGKPSSGWHKHPFAPSIDQIHAGRGYTAENCRMVIAAINNGLGEWGDEIFARVASAFLKKRASCEADNGPSLFAPDRESG